MNRKIYIAAGFLLCILVIVTIAIITNPSLSEQQPFNKTIETSGTGTVKATPDEAHLMVAVVSEALTAQKAAEVNADNMAGVFNELKNAGITEAKTRQYSITPIYKWVEQDTLQGKERTAVVIGYRVTNLIEVVCKPEVTGKAIDASVRGGANRIDSISFQLSEQLGDTVYSEALKKAVKNADTKAEVVSEAMGIGKARIYPVKVSVDEVPAPIPVRASVPLEGVAVTPVVPSEVEVRAVVRIVYAF